MDIKEENNENHNEENEKNQIEEIEADKIIDEIKSEVNLEENSLSVNNIEPDKEAAKSRNEEIKKKVHKNKYKIIAYTLIVLILLSASVLFIRFTGGRSNASQNSSGKKDYSFIENIIGNLQITPENVDIDYKTIRPNEAGDILVVMYHNINDKKKRHPWQNSTKQFRRDLQYMYDNDYVLIGIDEYLSGRIDIPAGKTPILLTFDDGLKGAFSLVKNKNGELVAHPKSMIGMLEEFKKNNPDFGSGGVLYVTNNPFDFDVLSKNKTQGSYKERFKYLIDRGYTVGNHTKNHPDLKTKSKKVINNELGYVNKMVLDATGDYNVEHLAYPYGSEPKKKNLSAVRKGKYKGVSYNIKSAMLAAPEKPFFISSVNENFKPYAISRAIATKGRYKDLHWYFDYYKKNPSKKYISDGNVEVLSVPKSKKTKLNKKKVENLNLIYYNKKTGNPLREDGTEVGTDKSKESEIK